ncbi:HIT family protein [Allorhizobium sp. BGMRC 0089]|uniref:HIT family protein n=1 Tax=Allorhizobium sonneratiae TaxID=2934936 RepID=UPI0020338533|nr:HIT family protein [Allorhizobium sonneratiae]MCM2291746.1 HIT family protein [Allorhizobium sonneratiae]
MDPFVLDERLARDSQLLLELPLSDLRLALDSRWPWLILVPRRAGISEIFELEPEDQAALLAEQVMIAAALKQATGAEKINIAAIGNIVRQLHVHIVARFSGDANWPGPIWGYGVSRPYSQEDFQTMAAKILEALQ